MKTLFLVLVLIVLPWTAFSQTRIAGVVLDQSGAAIPGANILIVNTYDGTSSDAEGRFSFTSGETGAQTLIVRFIGYRESVHQVMLDGTDVNVSVRLVEAINELEAVTITAGAFTADDQSRRTVFKAIDIATTAGATADIAGALNTLPGTQKVGESGRLFVRGGDGSEARTFIDGMLVLDAYGPSAPNTPSRGRFLPFMFKGTSFSTGGYSAEYGQALSSALALDSRDESTTDRTDVGLLSVGADVAHTHSWDRGSVAGKIQYTNIRPYFGLINQEVDWRTPPASLEGVGAFRQRTGKDGIVKLYGNFNQSSFSLYNHSIDDPSQRTLFDLTNRYRYINASYRGSLNERWVVRGGMSYTSIGNDIMAGQVAIDETEKGLHLKGVAEGTLREGVELKAGAEVIHRSYDQIMSSGTSSSFDEVITSSFAEADIYLSNRFVTRLGGRMEQNSLTGKFSLDPRASLAYKTDRKGQVSFAYGTFRQTAAREYVKRNTNLDSEKAEHFILNYQRISDHKTFRIETFYKRYNDLVKFNDLNQISNAGDGYAKGVELFWRDNSSVPKLDYWVSYSFLDTERDYLRFPHAATPSFASKHNFSIVAKYFIESMKSQLGATYSYASGRPYHDPNHERFMDARTPAYQDLSINWSYLPKPWLILYVSCTNIPGYDNIFGYEFSTEQNPSGNYNGRAIRQPAPRFLFAGVFITISKDKSMNQLPTL